MFERPVHDDFADAGHRGRACVLDVLVRACAWSDRLCTNYRLCSSSVNFASLVVGSQISSRPSADFGNAAEKWPQIDTLVRFASNVEELLRTRPLTETAKKKSLSIDAIDAADDVKEAREALETALGHVEREKRESQLTQAAKNNAMDDWSSVYPRSADCIAALFALAGREELANAVKPTARRRAGLTESPDNPEVPALPPPAAPPSTPATPATP